jgi:hypothetical protein
LNPASYVARYVRVRASQLVKGRRSFINWVIERASLQYTGPSTLIEIKLRRLKLAMVECDVTN